MAGSDGCVKVMVMNEIAPSGAIEANFDGLVGPTHHYAGLAKGNRASARNAAQRSNPREAALQGLAKMRALADLGLAQGLLPPQERPHLPSLRVLGYHGREAAVLDQVRRDDPELLLAVGSASSMWAANAATVSPSADTADRRVHFTPANLAAHRHRAIETATTARVLAKLFADPKRFAHHAPLPAVFETADEGAANHLRLCAEIGGPGLEVFVYGRDAQDAADVPSADAEPDVDAAPVASARQARAAGEAIAGRHRLDRARVAHLRQAPRAIAAGAFHNDVVAVAHRGLLLHHEHAFVDLQGLRTQADEALGPEFRPRFVEVPEKRLSLDDAVASYLFNSQLVDVPGRGLWMICAQECREMTRAWTLIQEWIADPAMPIGGVEVFDLRQSMRNGGGPACLRLRVVLTPEQQAAVHAPCWITPERHTQLVEWVMRHYRDRLVPDDLADPQLLDESRTALDRLTQLLGLGSLYEFQR